jgi:hypothetical protein
MERMIRIAWRTFWVGLGASGVLIAQSLAPAPRPAPRPPLDAPLFEAPPPAIAHAVRALART